MVYQIKNTPDPRNSTHEILLIFDDDFSIDSIEFAGLLPILFLIILYIVFILWSLSKDKEKEVYAPNVETKIKEGFQIKPDNHNIKKIDLDYTNETIDITSITSEDIRQYSNMVITESEGTPSNENRPKVIRFDTASKKTEGDEVNLRSNDKTATMNLDLSEIKPDNLPPHIVPPISDESIFRSTKRDNRKRGAPPTAVIRKRETVSSKFWRLLFQRHVILSTKYRMSRISPRWKRVGLLYFLLLLDMFLASISFIDMSISSRTVKTILQDSFITWICFGLISRLSSVSKDRLKDSLSTQDFQNALYEIENESKVKTMFTHFIIFIFAIFSFIQFGLFYTYYTTSRFGWIFTSIAILFIQVVVIEMGWTLFLSSIYIRAYQSRFFKKLYKILNLCRFWRI